MTMISVSIVHFHCSSSHFSPTTFSISISCSFYVLFYFLYFSLALSRSLLMQSSIAISVLPRLLLLSTFWASALIANFRLPFFPHDQPISTYSSPVSSKSVPSLQPPLSMHVFFSDQLSRIPRFFLPGCFRKPGPCFSVSAIVSR